VRFIINNFFGSQLNAGCVFREGKLLKNYNTGKRCVRNKIQCFAEGGKTRIKFFCDEVYKFYRPNCIPLDYRMHCTMNSLILSEKIFACGDANVSYVEL
jgi:hypothetical protein